MIERYTENKLVWVDLFDPTAEEIREIVDEFDIPPELAADLSGPITRSFATYSDKVLKVVMDFPVVKRTDITHPHEVKFLVTKNALVTVRYEDIEAIHRFKKEFEVVATLHKTKKNASGAHIFIALLSELYRSLESKLDYIESKLASIESEIFNEREKEMVFEISNVTRRLITFRQTIKAHDDVFRDAKPIFDDALPKDVTAKLYDLHTDYFHVLRRTTAIFESLEELRETNAALLTTKQNEIIKILTIMAFVTFPLSLFASIFGMNTKTLPFAGFTGDFWFILGFMLLAAIGFFVYFKYKRWM